MERKIRCTMVPSIHGTCFPRPSVRTETPERSDARQRLFLCILPPATVYRVDEVSTTVRTEQVQPNPGANVPGTRSPVLSVHLPALWTTGRWDHRRWKSRLGEGRAIKCNQKQLKLTSGRCWVLALQMESGTSERFWSVGRGDKVTSKRAPLSV